MLYLLQVMYVSATATAAMSTVVLCVCVFCMSAHHTLIVAWAIGEGGVLSIILHYKLPRPHVIKMPWNGFEKTIFMCMAWSKFEWNKTKKEKKKDSRTRQRPQQEEAME